MTDPTLSPDPQEATRRPPWFELGLAHDINALLGIILGRSQLLLQKSDDPEIRRQLEHIVTATRDAAQLAREILDGPTGRPAAPPALTRVLPVVEECRALVLSQLDSRSSARDPAVDFVIDVSAKLIIPCAPSVLRRIVINLFSNALASMPAGGRLMVRGRMKDREVELSIEDSGTGLDPADLTRIFEPGFTRGKPLGTGLGLAISRDLMERLGGRIEVAIRPEHGTRFSLHFPGIVGAASLELEPDAAAGQISETPQRILVVDNEGSVRDFLAEVLRDDGHHVVLAAAASEALQLFRPGNLDLVLADLTLPGMDGLELARKVRQQDDAVAVAVFSGWSSRFLQDTDGEESVDLTATKPLDVGQLRQLVAKAAELVTKRRRHMDASEG